MVVTEGKEGSLTSANIHVITDYFVDKINDYLIVDPPTSGRLVAINNEHQAKVAPAVTIFSVDDLEKQRIRVSSQNTVLQDSQFAALEGMSLLFEILRILSLKIAILTIFLIKMAKMVIF